MAFRNLRKQIQSQCILSLIHFSQPSRRTICINSSQEVLMQIHLIKRVVTFSPFSVELVAFGHSAFKTPLRQHRSFTSTTLNNHPVYQYQKFHSLVTVLFSMTRSHETTGGGRGLRAATNPAQRLHSLLNRGSQTYTSCIFWSKARASYAFCSPAMVREYLHKHQTVNHTCTLVLSRRAITTQAARLASFIAL